MSQSRWEDRAYNLRRGHWIGLRERLGGEMEKYRPEELILIFDSADEGDGSLRGHLERGWTESGERVPVRSHVAEPYHSCLA